MSALATTRECGSHGHYAGQHCPGCMAHERDEALFRRIVEPGRGAKKRLTTLRILAQRDGSTCCWCERAVTIRIVPPGRILQNDATIEHMIPVSKGGTDEIDNLKIACHDCNSKRGNADRPPDAPLFGLSNTLGGRLGGAAFVSRHARPSPAEIVPSTMRRKDPEKVWKGRREHLCNEARHLVNKLIAAQDDGTYTPEMYDDIESRLYDALRERARVPR